MVDATVTSRVPASTKIKVQRILKQNGTNSSKVINALFDRIVEEGNIAFLSNSAKEKEVLMKQNLKRAIEFVDSIPNPKANKFDEMSSSEIKMQRLKDRGLL